jgi:hypothetical protein
MNINQHYLSHHAVLPPYDLKKAMEEAQDRAIGSPEKYDPYD